MFAQKRESSQEYLLEKHEDVETWRSAARIRSWYWLLTGFNVILFLSSITVMASNRLRPSTEASSWLRESSYFYKLRKFDKEMDGSLFLTPNPSPYRNSLSPTEVVDDAWKEIEWIRTFPITADHVRKIGKDPELAVKFPPEYGLGEDAYVAQLDIFHQLHCLNLLRHIAWGEFDRDGKTAKRPYSDLHWIHVAHCTEILRENLMCSANLDVITFNWKETQDLPFADFNLNKKCTNAEILLDWQEGHTLPADKARNFTKPASAKEVPIGDEYFRIFGVDKVDLHHGEAHKHSYQKDGQGQNA